MKLLTDEQVRKAFGDPRPYIMGDGSIAPMWEMKILSRFPMPAPLRLAGYPDKLVRTVSCHRRIAPFLQAALTEICAVPGLWATLDDWGGCYAWRLQRGAKVPSRHSWAIAIDVDVKDNPQGDAPGGGDVDLDPRIPPIMDRHGFYWGGLFSGNRVDQMHFEFADLSRLGPA